MKVKVLPLFITIFLSLGLSSPTFSVAAVPDTSSQLFDAINYLKSQQGNDGCISGFGGETAWTVVGSVAGGIDPAAITNGGALLVDCLKNNQPSLSSSATTWEREILAIVAAGESPYAFAGINYVSSLQALASSGQIGSASLLNDDFFGVLALIASGSTNKTVISNSVDFIIANQQANGSFSWSNAETGDTNDTAYAIQALKAAEAAGFTNTGLSGTIAQAEGYLFSSQNSDGGWGFFASSSSDPSSTAAVIPALVGGNDTVVEDGLEYLLATQNSDGSFAFSSGSPGDTFTTSSALLALAQKNLPIGVFFGDIPEETQDQPVSEAPGPQPAQPKIDDDQALSARDENGKVLGEVVQLPDTGANVFWPIVWGLFAFITGIAIQRGQNEKGP